MCLGEAGLCFSELNVAKNPFFPFMLDNKFLMASRRKLYLHKAPLLKRFICHCSGYTQIFRNGFQIGHANFSLLDFISSPNFIRIPAWLLNYIELLLYEYKCIYMDIHRHSQSTV